MSDNDSLQTPPPGVHRPQRGDDFNSALAGVEEKPGGKLGFWKQLKSINRASMTDVGAAIKRSAPRRKHFIQDSAELISKILRVVFAIVGPIFSAVSIWISVVGIAFTIFSGVEPFIQLAHWVRYVTIRWRALTHNIWDTIAPYIGIEIPIDLKDFATFVLLLLVALLLAFFSTGRRLIIYESIVGIRMAIFGIAHAISPSRADGSTRDAVTALNMLFFEVNTVLARNLTSFFVYTVPFLTAFNLAFRTAIIFIPMIILVPETAFEENFGVTATRVEYLFLSVVISYSAAVLLLLAGFLHVVAHFVRGIYKFFTILAIESSSQAQGMWPRVMFAVKRADFGLKYESSSQLREIWNDQPFLARFSVSMIKSNWLWWPISSAESEHRLCDPFLWISERRFADPAFLDRIAKGLFLFFILFALNWVSINGDNIMNMFEPPKLEP